MKRTTLGLFILLATIALSQAEQSTGTPTTLSGEYNLDLTQKMPGTLDGWNFCQEDLCAAGCSNNFGAYLEYAQFFDTVYKLLEKMPPCRFRRHTIPYMEEDARTCSTYMRELYLLNQEFYNKPIVSNLGNTLWDMMNQNCHVYDTAIQYLYQLKLDINTLDDLACNLDISDLLEMFGQARNLAYILSETTTSAEFQKIVKATQEDVGIPPCKLLSDLRNTCETHWFLLEIKGVDGKWDPMHNAFVNLRNSRNLLKKLKDNYSLAKKLLEKTHKGKDGKTMRGWDIVYQDPSYLDNFPNFKEKINSCTDMWRTQWVVKSLVSLIENNLAIVDNCRDLTSYKQTALAKLLHYKWSLKHLYFFAEKYPVRYENGCLGNFVGLFKGIWDDTTFATWKKVSSESSMVQSGSASVDVNKKTRTISLAETSQNSEAEVTLVQTSSKDGESHTTSETVVTSSQTVSSSNDRDGAGTETDGNELGGTGFGTGTEDFGVFE